MKRFWPTAFSLVLIAVFVISFVPQARPVYASGADIVISQVYGGGGNTGGIYTNDFVELFNRGATTVSLAGWSVQYTSATGTGLFGAFDSQLTPLFGSIAPGQYILVQGAAGSTAYAALPTPDITDGTPLNISGTGGKVALANTATSLGCNGGSTPCSPAQSAQIVDLVGWDGANFYEGSGAAPATTNPTAILRNNGGCVDTDNNSADFAVGAPTPRNSASAFHYCTGPTNPTGVGLASPAAAFAGDPVLLTIAVTAGNFPPSTGLAVSCDLSLIGGSSTQILYDDGTNGDVTAGDNTFSLSMTVTADTPFGTKSLMCTVSDTQLRSSTTAVSLNVLAIIPIGQVNGAVSDTENATLHRSPYAPASGNGSGQTVTVQGVIYEKTLQATATTSTYKGFFLQNTAATADGNPNTSDGLFVYMGTYSSLIGGYVPQVGDEVVITGKIQEYYNYTEMSSASLAKPVVRSGVIIKDEVPAVAANPPANLADANRYWERMQSMRVQVPQDSIVLGGRNVFSPADAEIWVARDDSTIGLRTAEYTNRSFRDAHPLDDNPGTWDGNGYRILMGSLGIKYQAGDAQALIDPARTFDTLTNAPAGGLNYTFSKYRIEITDQPVFSLGPDPAQNNPPSVIDPSVGFSIVDYNLENLYDFRDNPNSECDFVGDTNCLAAGTPFLSNVKSPFDYVPASQAAYDARINDIALEIINDLHSPDILMVQEVENQDVCSVVAGTVDCGTNFNNPDGKPDVLQDLAVKIASLGGPAYDAAYDPDSSDLRGILPAFLFRTDRVELRPAAGDPVLGTNPTIGDYAGVDANAEVSNPKTLNAVLPAGVAPCETSWVFPRAPDIGLFRIYNTSIGVGGYRDVYVINNHFKSGPDTCVAHRTEQAKYNAALVAFIQSHVPEARIVMGGDLNVYPRPDDPIAPIGQPTSSDQLGSLYDPALGLKNLWEVLLSQHPEAAYSYVYLGQAQTLDQMFVNQAMLADLGEFRIAHINSDFPADYSGDVARGTSDHDPNVANFMIFPFSGFLQPVDNLPELNIAKAGSAIPVNFSLGGDQGLSIFAPGYPTSTKIACETAAAEDAIEQTVTAGNSSLQYDPLTQTYTYVWKTDKTWANSCRQMTVKFIDGAFYQASFQFTK